MFPGTPPTQCAVAEPVWVSFYAGYAVCYAVYYAEFAVDYSRAILQS
jgi:hypothetical protein